RQNNRCIRSPRSGWARAPMSQIMPGLIDKLRMWHACQTSTHRFAELADLRSLRPCGYLGWTTDSVGVSLRPESREHGGRSDGQVAQPNPGRRENGIADGGRDDRRARLTEADWSLDAVDELDVELRHVSDAQRCIAVEVCVLHLALDELGSLMERHAQAPE